MFVYAFAYIQSIRRVQKEGIHSIIVEFRYEAFECLFLGSVNDTKNSELSREYNLILNPYSN